MSELILALAAFVLFDPSPTFPSPATGDTCVVTYVANEGFLIETGEARILVDALFGNIKGNWCDQPGDSIRGMMVNGRAPFDSIDALLVTHRHVDHFDGTMAVDFLKNNRNAVLICPGQVNELLQRNADYASVSDRIRSVRGKSATDTSLSEGGVHIRALPLKHGPYLVTDTISGKQVDIHRDVEHLGYLIQANGFEIFHSGDSSPEIRTQFQSYGLDRTAIDIAFLGPVFLGRDGQDFLNESVHASNLVFMHIDPGKVEYFRSVIKNVPGMYVFASKMENKIYLKSR